MRRRGFSFMEVLISVVVLTIGILATMSAMTYTLGSIDHGGLVPTATIHAQRLIERTRAQNLGFNDPSINSFPDWVPLDQVPYGGLFLNEDVARFERRIRVEALTAQPYQVGNLVRVTVEVRWRESRGMDEQHQGSRMVAGKTNTFRKVELLSVMRREL